MDSQPQLHRTHGQHQAEEPIRIHHPEEEGHHEKGPSKVLKKVKEKAKKIKNALTKHGHGHDHHERGEHIPDDHDLDEEDDEDDFEDKQVHGGAPARGKTHIPVNEEIPPPGKSVFPVMSSSHTKHSEPMRGAEPVHASQSHGHQTLPHHVGLPGVPEKGERRGAATLTPHNTPVSTTEDVTRTFVPGERDSRDHRRVNMERPRGLEEDPAAPGGGSGSLGGIANYQSKVTDPTGKAGVVGAAASSVAALGRRKGADEDDQLGLGRDLPERRHGLDIKSGSELGKQLPARNLGSGYWVEFPAKSHESDLGRQGFDSRGETQQPNQSSYSDKIASVTSVVADKAVAVKNAVATKLGYTGEGGDGHEIRVQGEQHPPPSSGGGYGDKVLGMVAPVYEKVKETGATVLTKLPLTGGGGTSTEMERQHGQDKGVSAKEYVTEKLTPGEEDKALSEVVAEKLHLGGGGGENTTAPVKRGTVTQSEEVEKRLGGFTDQRSEEARKHGEAFAEEGEGGMVEKLKGAVTSWIAGTTDEVMQKSTESVQDSSASLGSTVGNMGMSGSGADGAGQRSGGKSDSVPVQKRFQ